MDNSTERYILLLVNLQLFACYALVIQNKVILQERSFAESKRVADCIYSYGTQSRADMTLPVTLTGIFVTNWIMRLFGRMFYLPS